MVSPEGVYSLMESFLKKRNVFRTHRQSQRQRHFIIFWLVFNKVASDLGLHGYMEPVQKQNFPFKTAH